MQRLVAICRVHLIGRLATRTKLAAGLDGFAEWSVEAGCVFCRIGHDLDILLTSRVKCGSDRANTAIHHVGRGDDIAAGICLMHRQFTQNGDGFIIQNLAINKQPVMPMIGKWIERDITDDTKVWVGRLDGSNSAADQIVAITGKRPSGIFLRRINRGENGNRWNTEGQRKSGLIDKTVY